MQYSTGEEKKMFNIRSARPEEAEAISDMFNRFQILRDSEEDTTSEWDIQQMIKNENCFIFLLLAEEKIAAVISGEIWKDRKFARVTDLAVEKEQQNKGYGKKLINYCIDWFLENGLAFVTFYTREENKIMQKVVEQLDSIRMDGHAKKGFSCIHYDVRLGLDDPDA
jgi:ribosomal protein S18 acetylase RimI-like enzyme